MVDINFIAFYSTLSEALTITVSPETMFYELGGVQLLPNNTLPYVQKTSVAEGINLEDWKCYAVNCRTGQETEITAYFAVDSIFTDNNGKNQFYWSITNIPFDFGNDMIYLKVTQLVGETFYSNLFNISANESDKTCRIDYKSDSENYQSVQLKMFFWQNLKTQEISSYYETSTKNTVTTTIKSQKHQRWITDFISIDLMEKLSDVFEKKFVYINQIRAYLFEAIDLQELQAQEYFKENIVKIAFNKNDTYDPLYVAPAASNNPSITLSSVVPNGTNAIYTFSYANFTPDYLTFQYSSDQVNWTSTNNGVVSPQSIPFNGTGTWYFRIIHPEAESNVIQLDLGNSVVAVNDKAQVEKGGTIDIAALFNDTLVGDTTITAVSTPNNGSASIIESGTKIQYVHDDSATTSDTFTYTISNGITQDTATITITVVNSGTSTSFAISSLAILPEKACVKTLDSTKYHNGVLPQPGIGDFVFNDAALTTPFDGLDGYFAVYGGRWIQINSNGKVIDVGIC